MIVLVLLVGCAQPEPYAVHDGQTMGTYYRVQGPAACLPDIGVLEARLADLNAALSTYDPNSELSRINAEAQSLLSVSPEQFTPTVHASNDLEAVVEAAQAITERTGGAFDATVGPVVNLWGFGPDKAAQRRPSAIEQQAAAALIGMTRVRLVSGELSVQAGTYLDLSAIAKGYAVDALAEVLVAGGCRDYMVDIGGEMRLAGKNARGAKWRIGIERPDPSSIGALQQVLAVTETAIATSGDYRNFRMVDGQRVDHVIDPRAGRPAQTDVLSATVLHEEAMWADALATAMLVLPAQDGLALAEREGVAALIIRHAGETGQGRAGYNVEMNTAMTRHIAALGASTE